MSLAERLAALDTSDFTAVPGPVPACQRVYAEHSDEETWAAVHDLVSRTSWKFAHERIDSLLEVTERIGMEKFRYHWRRRCSCWPPELRA